MKRLFNWQVIFGIILIALSATVYFIHYLIFRDALYILSYIITDIAFVFIEVLLVTLVLHELLAYREKKSMLKKLNMVNTGETVNRYVLPRHVTIMPAKGGQ